MTAEEFLNSPQYPLGQVPEDWEQLVIVLKEFTKLKCAEQRVNCNINAKVGHSYGNKQYETDDVFDVREHTFYVDKDSILNAPEPEL